MTAESVPKIIIEDIVGATGCKQVQVGKTLQHLWSGYGGIVQLELIGEDVQSVVLKLINPPKQIQHPRGWNTDASRERKLRSYQIETSWYESYAEKCNELCRVPQVLATGVREASRWILMEDLNASFPCRAQNLSIEEASVCLKWLATFHARFLGVAPTDLWPIGTYWHLGTRADEHQAMPEGQLKTAAYRLDALLNHCEYQTLVHGDAKVANFCFGNDFAAVAAVDFQYVGGGVGIKDVAYFLGSCIDENTLEKHERELLGVYFDALNKTLASSHSVVLANKVASSWSDLYAVAWTDFYRFLQGWSPGHKKINRYTRLLAERAFAQL